MRSTATNFAQNGLARVGARLRAAPAVRVSKSLRRLAAGAHRVIDQATPGQV